MNQELYCQSCGMPLTEAGHFGTEKDGSPSQDYCTYCYQKGSFTDSRTMAEMIELCLDIAEKEGIGYYGQPDRESAKRVMGEWFPTMKRWKKED